jgi:hypothetical protein
MHHNHNRVILYNKKKSNTITQNIPTSTQPDIIYLW